MKKIYFLRHAPLEGTDIDLLYQEFIARALKTKEFGIDIKKCVQIQLPQEFYQIEKIFFSPLLRSEQTAQLVQTSLKKIMSDVDVNLEQINLLREIDFSADIVTKSDYEDGGFEKGRLLLLQSIFNGKNKAEPLQKSLLRAQRLFEFLHQQKEEKILCISHAYFMRMIKLFIFEDGQMKEKYDLELIDKLRDSYLSGFSIVMQDGVLIRNSLQAIKIVV